MSRVLVTVRKGDEADPERGIRLPVRQEVMDRDSAYFQDFRAAMQADLDWGHSITITPLSDLDADAMTQGTTWPS